eukprot:4350407-Alexandrium_andersonii.AAC.1
MEARANACAQELAPMGTAAGVPVCSAAAAQEGAGEHVCARAPQLAAVAAFTPFSIAAWFRGGRHAGAAAR